MEVQNSEEGTCELLVSQSSLRGLVHPSVRIVCCLTRWTQTAVKTNVAFAEANRKQIGPCSIRACAVAPLVLSIKTVLKHG
jgi:hypothetical protein